MSDWIDYLKGAGFIGMAILICLLIVLIILAPLIVAILIANVLAILLSGIIVLDGLYWWATVIVLWIIIAAIISKLNS